jgi:hypothetical protein
MLGIQPHGAALLIDPGIPSAWPGFELVVHYSMAGVNLKAIGTAIYISQYCMCNIQVRFTDRGRSLKEICCAR